ncbi:MAG: hypothetical protein E7I57_09845 [Anaerococcus vaginalis]|uniref:hypothetical protein n=1 Tax=Anaerococcus vaginalis TaxID=33037 RepID=UPI00290E85E3|nr:hypothetical protein [Anaerococcus vaginalis]MDU4379709.1 hypothetical protein [Anaerococcus vaginalis]
MNIPVIPIVAADKKEYKEFYAFLERSDSGRILADNNFERAYESAAGDKYKLLKNYIPDEGIGVFSKSWIVGKLFDQDVKVIELVKDNVDEYKFKEIDG